MSTDDFTFANAMELAPEDPALTTPVIGKLEGIWGELPASEVASLGRVQMLRTLNVNLSDKDGYDNGKRMAIADAIIKLLKRLDLVSTAPQQPIKVTFDKADKAPGEMSARELLAALVAQPDAYDELKPFIDDSPQIQKASKKSNGQWVITTDDAHIDLELTMKYIAHLGQRFSTVQRQFNGLRPTNLAKALGHDERALIHPFTGKPVQGPDDNGFDLSELDPELHEALLWGLATGHSAWPVQIDLYTYTEEVLTTPLGRRWQRILDDYRFAKQEDDATTRLITRFWPAGLSTQDTDNLASVLLGTRPGRRSASINSGAGMDYRQLLESMAQSRCDQGGTHAEVNGGIYHTIDVRGTAVTVHEVIVLQGGSVTGTSVSGTIYAPPGVSVRVRGTSTSVRVINLPWEALARKAGLVG